MKGIIEITDNDMAAIFKKIGKLLDEQGFEVARKDFGRPWGGFFCLERRKCTSLYQYLFS
jgi:EAL domain-containing protein (putative c-di-GMP-specific phosphodiesterase class I)